MSEKPEASTAKKRRIIHWDPDHGNTAGKRRWTLPRILAWSVGGFVGVLLVAGVVIRGIKLVFGPQIFQNVVATSSGGTAEDAGNSFVSQSKAELARESASKALADLRRLPQDHPTLLQRLIAIETAFRGGNDLLSSREYSSAYVHFDALNKEIIRFAESVKLKQETQKAYDDILLRMKDLERARSLAENEFETAFAEAGVGRQMFVQGSFDMAKKRFDSGYAALSRAEQALKDFVDRNIAQAQEAVAAGQRETALAAYRAALEKDPGNDVALQGMKRAEVADRVFALLREGAALESRKEFAKARDSYAKAFEIDGFSAAAQQGKARAERLEKETEFEGALASAEAARKAREWPKAIEEFERALKVYPQKDEVRKALADTRATAHREAVKAALAKAFERENNFEWEFARSGYNETLQLDPENPEAKEGYVRTGRMIRTLLQYDKLIEIAEERHKKAEFQPAIRTFNEAMAIKPAYLALTDRVEQLRVSLMQQSQPVDVTFRSDGNTWVSITSFRMLGRIQGETLKMLPGDYEIVGRRKGYQDVLLMLQVRNGSTPPVVTVACTLRSGT